MRIKVVGAGWFGCHIAKSLIDDGHDVVIHDSASDLFTGASGSIPARLHLGAPHYPRSMVTQNACKEHQSDFLREYGHLTKGVPVNVYAIAEKHSMMDFGTYHLILKNQIEILTVYNTAELGLRNVEGAVMIGERHIVIDAAREHFRKELEGHFHFNSTEGISEEDYDLVVDCTFCANDNHMVDRFEPCLVLLLEGPTYKAVTIMDGPFPSLYPWDEDKNLLSLSSARFTPFTKDCKTWDEAHYVLSTMEQSRIEEQGKDLIDSMAYFYPEVRDYPIIDYMTSIRAMPSSAADTRLVHVVKLSDRLIRIRSGKIDAVIEAERQIKEMIYE